jgi:hypothetical protein
MIRRIFLSAIAFLGLAASVAFAQTGPLTGGNNPAPAQPQATAQNQAAPYLNDSLLQSILSRKDSNMKIFPGKDSTTYQISFVHNNMNVLTNLVVSKGYIWMEIALGQPRDAANMPANMGAQLLETHLKIGPTFLTIRYPNGTPMLYLLHRVDRSITPERLADAFKEFLGDYSTSESVWRSMLRN